MGAKPEFYAIARSATIIARSTRQRPAPSSDVGYGLFRMNNWQRNRFAFDRGIVFLMVRRHPVDSIDFEPHRSRPLGSRHLIRW